MFSGFAHRNWRSIFILLSLLIDIVALALSGAGAFFLGLLLPRVPEWDAHTLVVRWIQFSSILIFFGSVLGLYRAAYHIQVRQQYRLALKCYFYSMILAFGSFYVFFTPHFPRRFTFLFFLLLPIFFLIGRAALNYFNLKMQNIGFGVHTALIYGYENESTDVFERFQAIPELGYRIVGIISKSTNEMSTIPRFSFSELDRVLKDYKIDRIFIPSTKLFTSTVPELTKICKDSGIKLKVLSPEAEELLRTARLYDIVGISLYSPPRTKSDFVRKVVKRSFDIAASLLILAILSPVLLLTAIAIYLETGSPVIFKQKRARTKGGLSFNLYKFRSMVQDADQMKENLLEFNESDGALFKIKDDPRITKVGKLLRKVSIDELPQLFNVLKGDMSLVGPRPLPTSDFDKVNEGPEFWTAIQDRETMRPGITGLWQISGRSDLGFREMVLLDLYYVENQSLLFDLEILFETFPVMLYGRGAY